MAVNLDQVPVVEARAANGVLVDAEAKWPHQMQGRLGGSAGSGDRARVGRDLGLDQDDVKWARHRMGAELGALGHAGSYDRG